MTSHEYNLVSNVLLQAIRILAANQPDYIQEQITELSEAWDKQEDLLRAEQQDKE